MPIFRLHNLIILWYLDLSDISMFEDLMTTSSNEDIPALDEVGYWNLWTMVRMNIYIYMNFYIFSV